PIIDSNELRAVPVAALVTHALRLCLHRRCLGPEVTPFEGIGTWVAENLYEVRAQGKSEHSRRPRTRTKQSTEHLERVAAEWRANGQTVRGVTIAMGAKYRTAARWIAAAKER